MFPDFGKNSSKFYAANSCRLMYNGVHGQDSNEQLLDWRAETETGNVIRQDGRTRRRASSTRHRCLSELEKEGIDVKRAAI